MKISPVAAELFHAEGRKDGWTRGSYYPHFEIILTRLKWIWMKLRGCGLNKSFRFEVQESFFECGNEISSLIKCWVFTEWQNDIGSYSFGLLAYRQAAVCRLAEK